MRNSHRELITVEEIRAEKRTFLVTQIIDYKVITRNSRVKFPFCNSRYRCDLYSRIIVINRMIFSPRRKIHLDTINII